MSRRAYNPKKTQALIDYLYAFGHMRNIVDFIVDGASPNIGLSVRRMSLAEMLKDSEIRVNWGDTLTPAHLLVIAGLHDHLRALINHGADIEALDTAGRTPLLTAAICNQVRCMETLVAAGANMNTTGRLTSMEKLATDIPSQACRKDNPEMLALAIAHGLDVDKPLVSGMPPLSVCAKEGASKCFKLLMDAGACPGVRSLPQGKPPFSTATHLVAVRGDHEMLRLVIEKGYDIDAPDGTGTTPLHWALMNGSPGALQCARMLINAGANPNSVTDSGVHISSVCQTDEAKSLLAAAQARHALSSIHSRYAAGCAP